MGINFRWLALPYLRLTSPTGELWEFGEKGTEEVISGDAVGFAQVITQTRSFYDVNLTAIGPVTYHWVSIAQCFAGSPERLPAKGYRYIQ